MDEERTADAVDESANEGPVEAGGSGGGWIKLVAAVAVIGIGILLAWWLGAFEYLSRENFDSLKAWLEGLGAVGPIVFILIWIAACVFFLPGLPVTVVGAFVFGPFWGTVYSLIGATLGATAAFLVGRYAARGMVEGLIKKNKALQKIDAGVERQGWRMLMITRLVPVFPFNAQNYVYGLTKIRLLTYVVLSLIFMAPGTAAYNFAAGKLLRGEFDMTTLYYLAGAAVLFVLLSLIPGWLKKRYGDDEALGESDG
jgi:uncharacterized membrane protein YdjX (TVP38/TMEM64 family)